MKVEENEYTINVRRLADGKQEIKYSLDGSFFDMFDNEDILDASLKVVIEVDKGSGWINLTCDIKGDVIVPCDRCLANLTCPIDVHHPIRIEFSKYGKGTDNGESLDVIVLGDNEGEIDLAQTIYDFVCLSLPIKKVHPEGKCDPLMLEKMKNILK
ncbi:MAG: YceD family protein [Bacteroidales bacterium]